MASQLSIRIAQAIGLTGAAWLSGNIAALTLLAVPSLPHTFTSPQTQAQQWHTLYSLGKAQNPPVAAASGFAFAYLAYTLRAVPRTRNLYILAAVATVGIVPWTVATMGGVNARLIGIAVAEGETEDNGKGEAEAEAGEVQGLLGKWARLNGVRSCFPLVGALVGCLAVLG